MTKAYAKILLDWQFYACLLLGPLSWWLLTFFMPLRGDWTILSGKEFQFVLLIGVYPILEEVVFRGLILEWLANWTKKRRYWGFTVANLLTSGLFVLAHLIYQPWFWGLLVFFPSLIFGYMKERHQSLFAPIILHSFYNLGFMVLFA